MIRLLGALCLTAFGAALGLRRAEAMCMRAEQLCELESSLHVIAGELDTYSAPLGEILERLASRCGGAVGALFSGLSRDMEKLPDLGFAALWENAVSAQSGLALTPAELSELKRLGCVLGRYDAQSQSRAVRLCGESFGRCAEAARAEAAAQRRMWTGLGTAAGALAAVMLL